MDLEIQFGELEETPPQTRLRPDHNRHYAVVPVNSPADEDLAIFVDLDAMRDMEDHAASDTSVELGGVMLGGQYEDEQGRPFVLVTDSLRAQHYEATKGSFKFTHDTWERITRERDEFPDELQMVGWYHTHPEWGVFLSAPDMFICDHFFNKRLDVALVIDPCRQDRGFFQWTTDPAERVRRTGGFYLVASRFRQHELDELATYLEGRDVMSADPRLRGSYPAPVVHVNSGQESWQTVAVLGMLAMQFCFLMLIAWRLMVTPSAAPPADRGDEQLVLQESRAREAAVEQREAEVDAKIEMLDGVVSQWDGTPDHLVGSLAERDREVQQLEDNVRAHRALEEQLDRDLDLLKSDLTQAKYREERLTSRVESLQASLDRQKDLEQKRLDELAELKTKVAAFEDDPASASSRGWHWTWLALAAVLGTLAGAGIAVSVLKHKKDEDTFEPAAEDSTIQTNNEMGRTQHSRQISE